MPGLFGSIDSASGALQVQRQAIEVTGHNLANVNTPGYARQRLNITTAPAVQTALGRVGTGAAAASIQQLRDALIDRQITSETAVRGSLESSQSGLQLIQAALGQTISSSSATSDTTGQQNLANNLSELFAAFQSVSTDPTSATERQVLVSKAQDLAAQFNQVSTGLSDIHDSLNDSLNSDVTQVNTKLQEIADLNAAIFSQEIGGKSQANDLRDARQLKLEELSKFMKVDTAQTANGSLEISVNGNTLVSGKDVIDSLETYDNGGGRMLVRTQAGGVTLNPTAGSIEGTISLRDGALADLRTDLDNQAGNLVNEVNALHKSGYSLKNTTGADFFTGTDAGSIAVNSALVNDPSLIQASGTSGTTGDNTVMLGLARLAEKGIAGLNGQTFQQRFAGTVAKVGQDLSSTTSQLTNQEAVDSLLQKQRDAVSGVSLDEEMTNLLKFQRAFEASAKLINTLDQMLQTAIDLKR